MDYKSLLRRNVTTLIAIQGLKCSSTASPQPFPLSNFLKNDGSFAASSMMTQLAAVQIIAAQEQQRQTVLKLLALQQFQGNLLPNCQRWQEIGTKPSVKVEGLDLLGTAAVQKRSHPRPSIISLTSNIEIPHSPISQSSAEMSDVTDSSSSTDELEESRGKTSHSRKYIDIVEENDILCGRGGKSNHHVGNKCYRQVVDRMKRAYQSCSAKTLKTDLSRAIVDHCCSYGARFIKLDEATGQYYILSRGEARKKTSQALRESKALKWTA